MKLRGWTAVARSRAHGHRAARRARKPRRRGPVRVLAVLTTMVVLGAGITVRAVTGAETGTSADQRQSAAFAQRATVPESATPTPSESARGSVPDPSQVSARARPSLRIPESGTGKFRTAPGSSRPIGRGPKVTYSVEVEKGLPYSATAVAQVVDRVLADRRGWTSLAAARVRRVPSSAAMRVLLATPETTDALCAPLQTGSRLSCRNGEKVILNAWRWANGAESYGDDLQDYRTYLINHEFGHALGNRHRTCPRKGAVAPVMAQQTKGLGGCRANPWPRIVRQRQ